MIITKKLVRRVARSLYRGSSCATAFDRLSPNDQHTLEVKARDILALLKNDGWEVRRADQVQSGAPKERRVGASDQGGGQAHHQEVLVDEMISTRP